MVDRLDGSGVRHKEISVPPVGTCMDSDICMLCIDSAECSERLAAEYKLCRDLHYSFCML